MFSVYIVKRGAVGARVWDHADDISYNRIHAYDRLTSNVSYLSI